MEKPQSAKAAERARHRQVAVDMQASYQFGVVTCEVERVIADVPAKPVPEKFVWPLAGMES